MKDFEDLLQYRCALEADCDVIVTNNPDDYEEFCQLPFFTSEDFVFNYFLEAHNICRFPHPYSHPLPSVTNGRGCCVVDVKVCHHSTCFTCFYLFL